MVELVLCSILIDAVSRGRNIQGLCRAFLRAGPLYISVLFFTLFACQEQTEERLCVLSIHVENLIIVFSGLVPFAVLKRLLAAFEKRRNIRPAAGLLDDNGFFHRLFNRLLLLRGQHFIHAADQILHKTDLPHVIAHQHRELLRKIIRIHVAVAGNQEFRAILAHHG